MKVGELMEKLKGFAPDAEILIFTGMEWSGDGLLSVEAADEETVREAGDEFAVAIGDAIFDVGN